MSTARQLIEQGIDRGIERGVEKGRRTMLLRQLGKRFGELPSEVLARIGGASSEELDRWTDDILDATSLEELFDDA